MGLVTACGGDGGPEVAGETGVSMSERVAQFAPVTLEFDASLLDERQKRVMRRLVEASDHLDAIYRLQVWRGNADPEAVLPEEGAPEAAAIRDYYELMYGPWDRIAEGEPFVPGVGPKPAGAGSYPEDMTKEEFEEWVGLNRGDAAAFTSYYTVIERDNGGLRAVPYSLAYVDQLEAAAAALRDAAEHADNPSLERFLRLRAESFLTDDYFDSEIAWMRLEDNLIDPTIGPYEVYEDGLCCWQASRHGSRLSSVLSRSPTSTSTSTGTSPRRSR